MRRLVGTGAIALIVGLAGCSGGVDKPAQSLPPTATSSSDPATVVPPPTSSAPTATATATPTKPELPAAAKEHSRAGAKAMAEYWLYAWDYALRTADSRPMIQVSASSCYTCKQIKGQGDSIIRAGGTVTSIHSMKLLSASFVNYSNAKARLTMRYITGQSRIRIPSTHQDIVGKSPAQSKSQIGLSWHTSRWLVDDLYKP